MEKKMYQVTCSPDCGFQVRSHDRNEVKVMTKEHGKMAHKMDIPDADAEKMIEEVTV